LNPSRLHNELILETVKEIVIEDVSALENYLEVWQNPSERRTDTEIKFEVFDDSARDSIDVRWLDSFLFGSD
jgi:hypothetical protein